MRDGANLSKPPRCANVTPEQTGTSAPSTVVCLVSAAVPRCEGCRDRPLGIAPTLPPPRQTLITMSAAGLASRRSLARHLAVIGRPVDVELFRQLLFGAGRNLMLVMVGRAGVVAGLG